MAGSVPHQPPSSARTSSPNVRHGETTGLVGFLRTRLFNTPTNILITIVSALL
jgi:general L-amino acid transport system permease protein